jgi:dihydroorotate dehydrogenase (fumarate)
MVSQQVEQMYIDVARSVKNIVNIPVALKISPYFSSMANMAKQFDQIGVNALVMFNRFYQPDIDPAKLEVKPKLALSTSDELTLRLRWVAMLYSRINADMAITGGVHTVDDVIKSVMAGAKVAMMTSALMKNGINHLTTLKDGMVKWMEEHDYSSVADMQGKLSQQSVAEPAAFERANYMKLLKGFMS